MSKSTFQKELRSDITQKLDSSLSDLKSMLGEKEFTDRLKKAAKLFADGIKAEVPAKKDKDADKPVKSSAKKSKKSGIEIVADAAPAPTRPVKEKSSKH